MRCISCGEYYRKTRYNPTDFCDACIDAEDMLQLDSEQELEIELLTTPTGVTQPVFYD